MYPLLKGYLQYWLANRTDSGGYQICMCSWESGQDMMKRWGWNQSYGGDRSTRIIRAPEHQAAMAHAAGVMKAMASELGMPAAEGSYWKGVIDQHVKLTRSLWNKDAKWFCDFNSKENVWQSGCNDVGPAVGSMGAGKQTYQLAPLFFHAPELGVDLLSGLEADLPGIVSTVSEPTQFGSDPPGSLTFASYCDTPKRSARASAVKLSATAPPPPPVLDPRCVQSIWAPHPFITISSAGNVNATDIASSTTTRLLSRVWGKMDARSRIHYPPTPSPFGRSTSEGSPYPGVSYECWNLAHDDGVKKVGPMAQSCGSEQYAWTAEATTVALIREVIGFRELPHLRLDPALPSTFLLRPALPADFLRERLRETSSSVGSEVVFTVRALRFRDTRFDLHYTLSGSAQAALLSASAQEVDIKVRLEEVLDVEATGARSARRVEFTSPNTGGEFHISVVGGGFAVAPAR
jgi:hypothetical protein